MRGADGGLPADRNARWVVGGMVRSGRSSVREKQISCRAASRKPGLAPYDALTYHPDLGSDVTFVRKGYSPWIGRSGFGRYAVLWIALLAISAAIVLPSEVPVAGPSPLLAVAVATLSAAVGLALLQLGILRFLTLGDVLDLCVGLAFGTLALANLVVRLAAPVVGMEPSRPEVTL